MIQWAAAEMNRNAATHQAKRTSNSVLSSGGFTPGASSMKVAVTGSAKSLARASTATPWAACRNPMTTL